MSTAATSHHRLALYATPPLDDDDRRVIDEIEDFRWQLRYRLAEPRRGQLRRRMTLVAGRGPRCAMSVWALRQGLGRVLAGCGTWLCRTVLASYGAG
jgi:hypothetical protein